MSTSISANLDGNVYYLYLNRPEVFNSFNREMALCLQEHLDIAAANPAIRAVVICGKGRAFCAGQDLKEVTTPEINPGFKKILEEHYNPIILKIRTLNKPVIAAVNGVAAGAGANIALACDLVVASSSASFIQAFSKIGLVPDSGGTFFLPRLIGFQKASALMMMGDKISAQQADQLGMVYKVIPHEIFQEEIAGLAQMVSKMPTQALADTKQLLNASLGNSLQEQLALESELQIKSAQGDDYNEGVAAFIEKRAPKFKGK